jgi:hypothetical protein
LIRADRKPRAQRTTALTCGLAAEVVLGTSWLAVSSSQDATMTAVFGKATSVVAVVVTMVLLAVTMVLATLAPKLPRAVLVFGVAIFSLAIAVVGVIAMGMLTTNPGIGFFLAIGWVLTIPIALEVRRASSPRSGAIKLRKQNRDG